MECDPESVDGCPRCRIPLPTSCCDLCDSILKSFSILSMPTASTRPRGTKIKKKYKPTDEDEALRRALDAFQEEVVIEEFGEAEVEDLGSSIILCNETLERIVDCAHWGHIRTPQQLLELTKWDRSFDLGSRIIALINQTHSPRGIFNLAPSSTPSHPPNGGPPPPLSPSRRGNTSSLARRRVLKCSKCGKEGQ